MRTVEVTVERKVTKNYNTALVRYGAIVDITPDESASDIIDQWTTTLKAKLAEAFSPHTNGTHIETEAANETA